MLSSRGYDVHGFEVNAEAVEIINSGRAHVVEPDLDILVRAAVQTGKLRAATEPQPADVFILMCADTIALHERVPDLSYVQACNDYDLSPVEKGELGDSGKHQSTGQFTEMIAALVEQEDGPHDDRSSLCPRTRARTTWQNLTRGGRERSHHRWHR